MKFACPLCSQHFEGDPAYLGRSIVCPSCGGSFNVEPATPTTAAAPIPALSIAREHQSESPDRGVDAQPQRPALLQSPKTSRLAIFSLALSGLSVLLGPFGCIPGIVCGHIARRAIRRDPALRGAGWAKAGLAVGYSFLGVMIGAMVVLAAFGFSLVDHITQAVQAKASAPAALNANARSSPGPSDASQLAGSADAPRTALVTPETQDYSVINIQSATIPSRPAEGPVLGELFHVHQGRIENAGLVLEGESGGKPAEIRLEPALGPRNGFSSIPQLVEQAARFRVATLLLDNGSMAQNYKVTVKTAKETRDLTKDAGLRLVFSLPQNGQCKTSLHLGLGRSRKEYVVGDFVTSLPPDLSVKLQNIKSPFGMPPHRGPGR